MCFGEQAKEGTRSGIQRYTSTRGGGQVVLGVDSGTLRVWDQHSGSCGVRDETSRRGGQLNVCGRDNRPDLVPTSVDRIDRALGMTEQMERVGGSLLDVTVSDGGETPGRGEDSFVLPLHFVDPEKEKTFSIAHLFAGPSLGTNHGHYTWGDNGSWRRAAKLHGT